jgi:outer membrane protein assembly factor BamB
MRRLILLTICGCLASSDVRADDFDAGRPFHWHQWRGPLANGVAPHGDPPIHWDENTNVQWKVEIPGEGNSTPVVWGDRIFVSAAIETERAVDSLPPPAAEPPGGYKTPRPTNYFRFVVISLDRNTGRVLWQGTGAEAIPHEGRHPTNSYASGSPTTDGRSVYASFGSRGICCFDVEGNLRWKRDLGDMVTRFGWGEGTSPVLHRDRLVVNWDHEGDSFLVVLDATTGETLWNVDRDEISSWSTPLVVEHKGVAQLIVSATRRVTSYDLADGRIIWECGGQTVNVIPSPVALGDVVYCMSGFRGSALYALPLDSSGDLTDTDRPLWHHDRGTPYVPSPLLYDDLLYFTRSNSGVLSCLDAKTGEPLVEGVRLPGLSSLYASPVGAAGRVYFVARSGTTLVINHQPKLEVLATNQLDDPIDASPVIVGKQLFLRGKTHLYCIAAQ